MDNTEETYISLCAGVDGLDLGLRLALPDARCVCYVEREAFCIAHLVDKMEQGWLDTAPIWTDIKTFDGKPWRGKVRGLIGGYPCQPFSVAGKQLGESDPRHLWPFIKKLICEIRPSWCLFENVAGHLRLGFDRVLCDLAEIGYDAVWTTIAAGDVGLPHSRKRLYFLATANTKREGNPKHVGNCGISRIRRTKKRVRSAYWGKFKLDGGKVAPTQWWAEGYGTVPRPLFVRVCNGMADELDERLSACGNGVVPIQAAVAFCTLLDFARSQVT